MAQPNPTGARPLPKWVVIGGSCLLVFHFVAIGGLVLSAPSGPWISDEGPNMSPPPPFAQEINNFVFPKYLEPLKLTHNYHFNSNRPVYPGVKLEVRLRDADGREIETVKLPDPKGCFWTRHRHRLLARALTDDRYIPTPEGEVIPAPGAAPPEATYWALKHELPDEEQQKYPGSGEILVLHSKPEHLLPRERPLMRPSDWSLVIARSFVRYLCREHGAASGELFRTTRPPVKQNIDAPWMDQTATFGVVTP